jgi:hypothetical protein
MLFVHVREGLSWLARKLISGLVLAALAAGWIFLLSFAFTASGLRARFQGADDLWIAAATVIMLVLMLPVVIAHGRIMASFHARRDAQGAS